MIIEGVPLRERGETPFAFALTELSLRDFRNYELSKIDFGQSVNLICGENAQGKTSLLEAVSLISTGRLLRSSRDAVAIRHGQTSARVQGELSQTGTLLGVELRVGVRKRVEVNGLGLPRASDLIGRLPTVSFSAADLKIVSGDPSERRQFLDWELAQLSPAYLRHLTLYKRALDQRNALLKQSQNTYVPVDVFEPWEVQLAEHGSALRYARSAWILDMDGLAKESHDFLGEGERLTLEYDQRDASLDADSLLQLYESHRSSDQARGTTSTGPHRDDLRILINGEEAKLYGSQGQQRTAVISLKLAVTASAENHFGSPPVLLLDDVFSDLDSHRRSRLVERTIHRGGQVFLTCTEAEQAGPEMTELSTVFQVDSGRVARR